LQFGIYRIVCCIIGDHMDTDDQNNNLEKIPDDNMSDGGINIMNPEKEKYLSNVPPDNAFVLSDGRRINNLEELYSIIRDSDSSVFEHHVTADRNDFANWIMYCINYKELYTKLAPIKEKEVFLGMLAEEIALIKNFKMSETLKYFQENPKDLVQKPSEGVVAKETGKINDPQQPVQSNPNDLSQPANNQNTYKSESSESGKVLDEVNDKISVVGAGDSGKIIGESGKVDASADAKTENKADGEEHFEFESILKAVIDEIENEMLVWNS
jgi:hypothetical protein